MTRARSRRGNDRGRAAARRNGAGSARRAAALRLDRGAQAGRRLDLRRRAPRERDCAPLLRQAIGSSGDSAALASSSARRSGATVPSASAASSLSRLAVVARCRNPIALSNAIVTRVVSILGPSGVRKQEAASLRPNGFTSGECFAPIADAAGSRIGKPVTEDIECLLPVASRELERLACPAVVDHHFELAAPAVPQEQHFEPVARPVGELRRHFCSADLADRFRSHRRPSG